MESARLRPSIGTEVCSHVRKTICGPLANAPRLFPELRNRGAWRFSKSRHPFFHSLLESLSKKFKKAITDERGYGGNGKIGSGKDISDCPSYTPLLPHA